MGIYDLGGNVWEWCMDESVSHVPDYSLSGEQVGMHKLDERILRGASFGIAPCSSVEGKNTVSISIGWQVNKQEIPLANANVYRSSFRYAALPSHPVYFGIHDGQLESYMPSGGLRLVIAGH